MAQHEADIVIQRPVADVWAFVADLAATPRWRTTVTSVAPPAELVVGAEFVATTRVLFRNWSWRVRVTDLAPHRLLAYEVVDGFTDIRTEYRLAALTDESCRFTLAGESRPRDLLTRLLDRPGAWNLRRETASHLPNLKRIMESDG